MKQRLGLALALLGGPRLVVLDEGRLSVTLELMREISGDELDGSGSGDPNTRALAVAAAWVTALVGVSVARFTRTDVD